jgi:signal transduction histidine kinase
LGSTRIATREDGVKALDGLSETDLRNRLTLAERQVAEQTAWIERMNAAGQAVAEYFLSGPGNTRNARDVGEGLMEMATRYVAGMLDSETQVTAGIYLGENPFNQPAETVCGELSRDQLERLWDLGGLGLNLREIVDSAQGNFVVIGIPAPRDFSQTIGLLAIDIQAASLIDHGSVESVLQAVVMNATLQMDRIREIDEARLTAANAHVAATVQLTLISPIELCSAMSLALEQMDQSDSVIAATAIDLTGSDPRTKGAFGDIDLETALRARDDSEFARLQRISTRPITLEGVTEGLIAVRFAAGMPVSEDDMLSSIVAAIVGSASRYRAATTIDALRRTTTRQLVEAQERDRAIVAADIHDGTLQQLGATAMRLELIRARAQAGDAAAMNDLIDRCAVDIRSCTRDLRNLLMELRPQVLDDNGLAAALGELGRAVETTDVRVTVDAPDAIEDDVAITVFRIVQEALNNVRKHAHAKHAWVDVSHTPESIRVEVRDDGVGFEGAEAGPSSTGQHFGLLGMRERARMMGGEFGIVGHSGGGTVVTAMLPLGGNTNQPPMLAA